MMKPGQSQKTDETRGRIIAAALRCMARAGVRSCNMADIAREAGLTRVTLYRQYSDRPALTKAIIHARFVEIIARIGAFIAPIPRLEDAIVQGAAYGLEQACQDSLLLDILEHGIGDSLDAFLVQQPPEMRELCAQIWRPHFAAARQSGELRSSLPDDRLIDGMLTIISPILLREGFTAEDRQRFIADFVIPAIFRS